MEERNIAYMATLHDRGGRFEVIIFWYGPIKFVIYDNKQGRSETQELHACPGATERSQIE